MSDIIPVPGWCTRRSARTLRLLWPFSEWPAPWPLSHRPPAQSLLHSYTTRDKKRASYSLLLEKVKVPWLWFLQTPLIIRGNVFSVTCDDPHQMLQTWKDKWDNWAPLLLVSQGFLDTAPFVLPLKAWAAAEASHRTQVCAFFILLRLNFLPIPPSLSPY